MADAQDFSLTSEDTTLDQSQSVGDFSVDALPHLSSETLVKSPVEDAQPCNETSDGAIYQAAAAGANAPSEDAATTENPDSSSTTTEEPTSGEGEGEAEGSEGDAAPEAGLTSVGPNISTSPAPAADTSPASSQVLGDVLSTESSLDWTTEPTEEPFSIDIPLEKKISAKQKRKLWEEIERRKPLIPKHVAEHIQKYAKPPFETWGCKYSGRMGTCFGCSK